MPNVIPIYITEVAIPDSVRSPVVTMAKVMMLVMQDCNSPCERNNAVTGRINCFRAINLPFKMGLFAFRSAITRKTREISPIPILIKVGTAPHPLFCPNVGMESSIEKKSITSSAPR